MTDYDHTAVPAAEDALFFDKDGTPLSGAQWSAKHSDGEYRFLGRDTVGDVTVITAWLGTDQLDGLDGGPHIFGTITHDRARDEYGDERFTATEADALAMHAVVLAEVTATTA